MRLSERRVAVPDVVLVKPYDDQAAAVPVDHVRLVVEIVSRSNARMDRVRKMHYYASAGIPFYLLIDRYVEQASVALGDVLELIEPVVVDIDTTQLTKERG